MCDFNINNTTPLESELTYSISNLPSGKGIYSGDLVVGVNTEFQLKSLVAGNNITLTSDANEITITAADDLGTYSVDNLGAGEDIYAGDLVVGINTEFQLKSLVAGNNITLTSDANEITITAADDLGTYSAVSLGTGQAVYAGDNVVGINTEFQFKSLVGGSNISIVSDANEITVNSLAVEVDTVTNLGSGAQVLVDVLGNAVRARTLTTTGNITINTIGNEIQIGSTSVTTSPEEVFYDYMSPITVSFSTNYQTTKILSSSVAGPINPQTEGVLTILTSTAFIYTPSPRQTSSVIIPVTLIFTDGTQVGLLVKMMPRLTWANDTSRDLLIGTGVDGQIYQIDMLNSTTKPLLNYDGTTVSSIIGATTAAVAMDQLDNILFYTQTGTPTTIRYYDFVTKLFGTITNFNATSGWSTGANISSMTFDQRNCVLYILGDINFGVIRVIHIPPFDRSVGYVFATSPSYGSVFPSLVGNVQQSICIDRNSKSIYGVVKPTATDTTWRTTNQIGGVATTAYSLIITGDAGGHCEIGPSGLAYFIGDTTLQWRKTVATRNTNNTTTTFISPVAFYDLTVSYFGNLS